MKVILKEYVPNLGGMGEVVNVSDGYGRNYLLPRGFAVRASIENVSQLEHQKHQIDKQKSRHSADAQALADQLSGFTCVITKAVGEGDRLYGSVTSMEIVDKLHEGGFKDLTKRQVELSQPIKELGEFEIAVRVYPEITATIKVQVAAREE